MTIEEFLNARLDEDEGVAQAAAALQGDPENGWGICSTDSYAPTEKRRWISPHIGMIHEPESAEHIARYNPARVLREVEAKRRIMARHKPGDPKTYGWAPRWCEGCGVEGDCDDPATEDIDDCPELRDLASAHADHKDYLPKWAS